MRCNKSGFKSYRVIENVTSLGRARKSSTKVSFNNSLVHCLEFEIMFMVIKINRMARIFISVVRMVARMVRVV